MRNVMVTRSKLDRLSTLFTALVFASTGMLLSADVVRAQALFVLHSFLPSNPANPKAPLIRASDGNFYGTTKAGGASNHGTAFKMTPAGTVTILHVFTGGADGGDPVAPLAQATDGNFYGTTVVGGGPSGSGTVFKIAIDSTFTVMHTFATTEGA